MPKLKYWLVSAIDDDPVSCQEFGSAVELAVAVRELIDEYASRVVYAFCFYGDRLAITKGPERCLVVPEHTPPYYALFGRRGESTEVDDKDGQLCTGIRDEPDTGYQKLVANVDTTEEDEAEILDDEDSLTEPEDIQSDD